MAKVVRFLTLAGMLAAVGCGNGGSTMTGPSNPSGGMMGGSASTTSFLSVSPMGGAVDVSVGSRIVMRFNHAMAAGMDSFVVLHQGDLNGPLVPMSCGWSGDRTALTCAPGSPLLTRTRYTIHMGAGMTDARGNTIDWDDMPMNGGQWAMPGMMQGGMMSPGMMGPGWRGANGSYGMVFSFTTA